MFFLKTLRHSQSLEKVTSWSPRLAFFRVNCWHSEVVTPSFRAESYQHRSCLLWPQLTFETPWISETSRVVQLLGISKSRSHFHGGGVESPTHPTFYKSVRGICSPLAHRHFPGHLYLKFKPAAHMNFESKRRFHGSEGRQRFDWNRLICFGSLGLIGLSLVLDPSFVECSSSTLPVAEQFGFDLSGGFAQGERPIGWYFSATVTLSF